jgi:hypothetical protein
MNAAQPESDRLSDGADRYLQFISSRFVKEIGA